MQLCMEESIPWKTDPTNRNTDYIRNRIRHLIAAEGTVHSQVSKQGSVGLSQSSPCSPESSNTPNTQCNDSPGDLSASGPDSLDLTLKNSQSSTSRSQNLTEAQLDDRSHALCISDKVQGCISGNQTLGKKGSYLGSSELTDDLLRLSAACSNISRALEAKAAKILHDMFQMGQNWQVGRKRSRKQDTRESSQSSSDSYASTEVDVDEAMTRHKVDYNVKDMTKTWRKHVEQQTYADCMYIHLEPLSTCSSSLGVRVIAGLWKVSHLSWSHTWRLLQNVDLSWVSLRTAKCHDKHDACFCRIACYAENDACKRVVTFELWDAWIELFMLNSCRQYPEQRLTRRSSLSFMQHLTD